MAFVQVIEMVTTKVAEIEELMSEWVAATEGRRSAHRSLLAQDRERPALCASGPTFRNLDVVRIDEL